MSERADLANRLPCFTRKFEHGGLKYFGRVAYFGDREPDTSRPALIFLSSSKTTSAASYQAQAAAACASLAFQYGCPLDRLLDALPRLEDGRPAEPVGCFLQFIREGAV